MRLGKQILSTLSFTVAMLFLPVIVWPENTYAVRESSEAVGDLEKGLRNEVVVSLVSDEDLSKDSEKGRRIRIRRNDQDEIGYWRNNAGEKWFIEFPGRPPIYLPRKLHGDMSLDGSTILQIGDEGSMGMASYGFGIYWADSKGMEISSLNYYRGGGYGGYGTSYGLSEDGYSVFSGPALLEDNLERRIGLYSPRGERIWEVPLAEDHEVTDVNVSRGGKWVAGIASSLRNRTKDNRLVVFDGSGRLVSSSPDWETIDRIQLLGDDKSIFVLGVKGHVTNVFGLSDLHTGQKIWQRTGDLYLSGVEISLDKKTLFLIVAHKQDLFYSNKKFYPKFLIALDASTGEQIMDEVKLPGEYGLVGGFQGIARVSQTQVRILVGDHLLTYDWKRMREAKNSSSNQK